MATAQLSHFTHPQHLLVRTQHHTKAPNTCDICGAGVAGLAGYRCDACDFDIHEDCAGDFKETISFFAHPWHALTLAPIVFVADDDDAQPTTTQLLPSACALCTEECPQGSLAYRCAKCGFDVHPRCAATLPQTTRSPLDPNHELNLVPAAAAGECTACHGELPVWHYRCGFCQVMLHVGCTSGVPRRGGGAAAAGVVHGSGAGSSQNAGGDVNVRPSHRGHRIANFLLETSITQVISQAAQVSSDLMMQAFDLGNSGEEQDNLDATEEPEI